MSSLNNLTPHITWLNTAKASTYLLGAHMLQIGLWAFISPRGLTEAFGMRFDGLAYSSSSSSASPNKPTENKASKAATTGAPPANAEKGEAEPNFWPLLFAPRELGFGALILTFAARGEWKACAVVVGFVGAVLATADGVVAGMFAKGGWRDAVASHFVPGGVIVAVAGFLAAKA